MMKIPTLYSQIKYLWDEPKPTTTFEEQIFTLKVPKRKNTDFYLTFTDYSNRFRAISLKSQEEYIPKPYSRIIPICSYIPERPFFIRKCILYLKYIPSFS